MTITEAGNIVQFQMAISGIHRGKEQDQTVENSLEARNKIKPQVIVKKAVKKKKTSDCNHGARD